MYHAGRACAAMVCLLPGILTFPHTSTRCRHRPFSASFRVTGSSRADCEDADANRSTSVEVLSCRIKGFYPFPGGPRGPVASLFRDTHQAIVVTTSAGSDRAFMDFMTEGGAAHPVWWDESVKWRVMLGGSIRGEVRMRNSGGTRDGSSSSDQQPSSKLERLRAVAAQYDTEMNLYSNNCRIFCARMEREVARLNAEDEEQPPADETAVRLAAFAADSRLALAVLRAGVLPALYPSGVFLFCWDGIKTLL